MELLEKKLSLTKKIKLITDQLFTAASNDNNDNTENIDMILEERQQLMDEIDLVDKKIDNIEFEDEQKKIDIEKEIKDQFIKIVEIDNQTRSLIIDKQREYKRKFSEIDLKIKTGNYDTDHIEKKPKGYFLNQKS